MEQPTNKGNGIYTEKPQAKRVKLSSQEIDNQKIALYKIIAANEGLNYEQLSNLSNIDKKQVSRLLPIMKSEGVVKQGDKTQTESKRLAFTYSIVHKKNFAEKIETWLGKAWDKLFSLFR